MIKVKHFVYLLKSTVSNRTYVGYTIDINRRLRQHNGIIKGGAKKTERGRPWELILFIGFPYERIALQYEFCIQHTKKYRRGTGVANKIKIMKALLNSERICSTAQLTSEFNIIIFFKERKWCQLWNSEFF